VIGFQSHRVHEGSDFLMALRSAARGPSAEWKVFLVLTRHLPFSARRAPTGRAGLQIVPSLRDLSMSAKLPALHYRPSFQGFFLTYSIRYCMLYRYYWQVFFMAKRRPQGRPKQIFDNGIGSWYLVVGFWPNTKNRIPRSQFRAKPKTGIVL
jgi:hypothetical protein